jgi:hypothetical protein
MRLWMLPRCDSGVDYPDWREGFVRARIDTEGALDFDALCEILATSTLKGFTVHRLQCPVLAEHESWTLQVLGLLQRDQLSEAASILAQHCALSGARLALAPARTFACALRAHRLWLAFHFDYPVALPRAQAATCAVPAPGSSRMH